MRTRHRILFRYAPPPLPGLEWVELRGEVKAWSDPVPLRRAGDGAFEAELELGPGIYAYKLQHADRSWHLDPANPRTVAEGGHRNSALVVGGTPEPVLHAPAAPWLFARGDGRVTVRAGLRHGAGEGLALRWDEGHGWREAAMEPVAETDEHRVFERTLPAGARALHYLFRAGSALVGRGAGEAFSVERRALRSGVPEWWKDTTVYTVFVDRFRRAGGGWGAAPGDEQARRGGDLEGAREGLDHLAELGVGAVHLTPVFASGSAHRYDVHGFDRVDEALGGEPALRAFVDAAHVRGLRVLLDVPATHVSRELPEFLDVRDRGPASPFFSWFEIYAHPFTEGLEPGYRYYQKGAWREPLLNLDDAGARAFVVDVFRRWARFGVDGFRVDAAAELPKGLLAEIVRAVRGERADAVVFGEITSDHVESWTDGLLDAGTDFLAQEALRGFLERGASPEATRAAWLRRRARRSEGHTRLGFSATHDQVRTLSRVGDRRLARLEQLAVLTRPEVPALLYGDEVGLASDAPERGFEDAWPDRMPMPWERTSWDATTLALVKGGLALRRASAALRRGDELALDWGHAEVAGFRRRAGEETVDVALHRGEGEVRLPLPGGAPPQGRLLLVAGEARIEEGALWLGPKSGAALAREASKEARELFEAVREEGPRVAAEAFVEGWDECPALPSRLYLTLTERCNLRCVHCITGAPTRTADGSARDMAPWVLDALREAFAGARYVGFSHGGESLVHRRFFETLGTIQQARAGRPGRLDVHLLTNGRRLDPETLAKLVDHGVTSLAISVDGATRETQELVRLGSRMDRLLAHVEGAVAARERGADLRVGLSAVLTTRLVPELVALGRRAAALGVDWLKIEETAPVNQPARELFVDPRSAAVRDAMTALRAALEGSGVTLVDHLASPSACLCVQDGPAQRAFREADDFANRAAFRPCRMAWEQIAIDPDGAVRPVDYEHPIAGRLDEAPLPAIWNGELLRGLRRAQLRRHDRATRERCVHGRARA